MGGVEARTFIVVMSSCTCSSRIFVSVFLISFMKRTKSPITKVIP